MRRLLLRTTTLGLAAAAPQVAHGQAAPTPPASAATSDLSSGDIIVTATRRAQRLKDVGIAISAVSGDALETYNVKQATDLVKLVPSLKMNLGNPGAATYNIRGVSQNDYGDQQEPPIAIYQDDSYSSTVNTATFLLFDLERVEVLRGPQGTLFGRNATGGAVQFISKQPTKSLDGYATVQVGSYGQLITEGAISGPITDNLQIRIAGSRDHDHGYVDNINPGYPNERAENEYALRGIVAWEPASNVKSTLTVRYTRAAERGTGGYPFSPACPNAQLQGVILPADQTCAYFAGNGLAGPGTSATGYRNDAIDPYRGGSAYKTAGTTDSYFRRHIFGSTLRLDATFGRVALVSITDYQRADRYANEDGDGSPDLGVVFGQTSRLRQFSQEIRALVDLGRNQLTVGGYGLSTNGHYTGFTYEPYADYYPFAVFKQNTKSFAFFAQDEWSFADKLKLIGGIRFWHDKRRGYYNIDEPGTGVGIVFNPHEVGYTSFGVLQPSDGITATTGDATPSFSGVTGRLELDYKPVDDVLLYASYNRGSKSGGFTFSNATPFPGGEVDALNGIPYKPEKLDALEAGVKATVAPRTTLDVTGFYYFYHDYQGFAQLQQTQTIVNLNARSKGIEVDFNSRYFRRLEVNLNASFLGTKARNILLPDLVTTVDHRLPQAPTFSGTATATYTVPLLSGKLSFQGDVQHSSSFCFTLLCGPVDQERAYTVADARIGYMTGNGRWEFAAFVQNLASEKYRVYTFDNSLFTGAIIDVYAKPRTWGGSITVHFGS